MFFRYNKKNIDGATNRGFTLIELLVVISIISLLSTIVLGQVNSAREKARDRKIVQEALQLRNAIEMYRTNYGKYPAQVTVHDYDEEDPIFFQTGLSEWLFEYGNVKSMTDLSPYLVDTGLISALPKAERDCPDKSCNFNIGYYSASADFIDQSSTMCGGCYGQWDLMCGGSLAGDYIIYIYWNGRDLKLPVLEFRHGGDLHDEQLLNVSGGKTYCLTN